MKMMRKIFALMLTLALVFGTMTLPSQAAYNASNVPAYLFDAAYYSAKYSDLAKAFGTDRTKLYNHWLTYGIKEGRSPSPVYDPSYYLNNNSDLKKAFGTDYAKLYEHWQNYGVNEFRKSSAIYDGNYYKTHYSDLQKAFGTDSLSYIKHFFNYGMSEGRQASSSFNVTDYKSRYSDLQKAFGNNSTSYYYHYMEYGISEGRNASPSGKYSPSEVGDTTSKTSTTATTTTATTTTATTTTSGTKWPATSGIKTYCLSSSNNTVVYQTTTSTAKYGTIYASDLVTIKGYDAGSDRFKVTYPVTNGTKTGYVARSSITSGTVNAASGTFTASGTITAYRRTGTSATVGTISKNDKCYKIAVSGNYTQVIYPISGGFKMGWIKTSEITNSSGSTSTATAASLLYPLKGSITTSSSTKTNGFYCDYKTGGSVAVYAPADGTVVFKQAYRNSGGTKKLSSYGNFIEFTSSDGVYKVKMCHLNSFNGAGLSVTQSLSYPCSGSDGVLTLKTKTVKQGDLLGYSGYTGNASGHHLHLEVYKNGKAVDPRSVFATW